MGLRIETLVVGGAAQQAGLRVGDELLSFQSTPFTDTHQLIEAAQLSRIEPLRLIFNRNKERHHAWVGACASLGLTSSLGQFKAPPVSTHIRKGVSRPYMPHPSWR
jgi:membrane-associated protease RseP (regulator of RpoE activity)